MTRRGHTRAGIYCVLPIVLAASSAFAEATVTARIDRPNAVVGEQFTLTVEVESSSGQVGAAPVIPQFDGVTFRPPSVHNGSEVFMGPGEMTQKFTRTFRYPVVAKKKGTVRFEGIHVVHDGKKYVAGPVQINVLAAGARPPAGTQQTAQSGPRVLLLAEFSKDAAYRGEKIDLTFTLLSSVELRTRPQFEDLDVNTFQGFFYENVSPRQIMRSQRSHEGMNWNAYLVGRFALYPVSTGQVTIDPVTMIVYIPTRGGLGFFGMMQSSRGVRVASNAATLNVKPLPAAGRPEGFHDVVGQLRLSGRASRQELEMGDALSLLLEVSGEANFKALGEPTLPELPGFTLHEPDVRTETRQERVPDTNQIRPVQARVWEYVLVPEEPGELEIGPVTYPVFNPAKEAYEILSTAPIRLQVRESTQQRGDRIVLRGAGGRQREVTLDGEDFRYIITDADQVDDNGGVLPANPGFLALNAVPIVVVIGAWFTERRRRRFERDPASARRTRAPARAKEILAEAEKVKNESGNGELDALLTRAIVDFLDMRFGIPARGMLTDELAGELATRGVGEDLLREVAEFLSELDESRFAGPTLSAGGADERIRKARELLDRLAAVS